MKSAQALAKELEQERLAHALTMARLVKAERALASLRGPVRQRFEFDAWPTRPDPNLEGFG